MDELNTFIVNRQISSCMTLIKEFAWLLDSYVLDFFTDEHMQKLPKCWRDCLEKISPEDLGAWISFSGGNNRMWPLSLISLRTFLKYTTLPRVPSEKLKINLPVLKTSCFLHPRLKNIFVKHVKPKKRHEILKMAQITADRASMLGVRCILDVGSGLGHLSRVLAYGHGLEVCCLEKQKVLSEQARRLDAELEATASKHLNDIELATVKAKRPVHVHETIHLETTPVDLVKVLKRAFNTDGDHFQFGIVGLHPCGDLAAILSKIFVNCPEARILNIVGCCYHKLTTGDLRDGTVGFPLSGAEDRLTISYEARALACHALETYCARLQSGNYEHLKIHCYRAALEAIIQKRWPEHRRSGLCNVKHSPHLTFPEYCDAALRKLGLAVPTEDFNSPETQNHLSKWEEVVGYYSLRLMMAPAVETVILLDRLMYLSQHGADCVLTAAFDPAVSPRNHILIAHKPT